MARTRPSERFRMHPIASECIRAGPDRSKHVPEATKTSENWETLTTSRTKMRNNWNTSEHIRTLPNASDVSKRIRIGPNRSEQVRTRPQTSENLRKPLKIQHTANFFQTNSRNFRFLKVSISFRRFGDVFGPVRTYSDAFGYVWMRSEASGCVQKHSNNFAFVSRMC